MASRTKNRPSSGRKSNDALLKLGIDIPDLSFDENDNSDVDDGALESELQALLTGKQSTKPVKRAKPAANMFDVEKMAAQCTREPSIDDDDDDELSGDEGLLAELQTLTNEGKIETISPDNDQYNISKPSKSTGNTTVDMLQERLNSYKEAETASKKIGDSSKARRYGRAVKTLEGLLKSAKSGRAINEEDIPPEVAIPKSKVPSSTENAQESKANGLIIGPAPPLPSRPAPPPPSAQSNQASLEPVPSETSPCAQLISRRNQYKTAALNAKKCGDNETALEYVKIAKKFDVVIEAAENGQSVDLSNMPPPPLHSGNKPSHSIPSSAPRPPPRVQSEQRQNASCNTDMESAALSAANEPADPELFNAPEPPATILEALEQRLEKYCSTRDAAKNEGNGSKARRLQRIVQQYEGAIKNYKAGKPVSFDELPTPPGFGPIPATGEGSVPSLNTSKSENEGQLSRDQISASSHTQPLPSPKTVQHEAYNIPAKQSPKGKHPKIQRANTSTILEKQLNFLLERQKLFRQAAIESKKNGDIQQAKEYLRMSKGFDSMIEATKCGLPIDASTIPTPPQLEADFVVIDSSECFTDESSEIKTDLFPTLEKELQHQIEMCTRNKQHFMHLGDVSSASKFEKLSLDTTKDLAFIQHLWRNNEEVPRFHYETRLFSLVQCNTDLADNEIEVTVERGINLPGKPDDLDAYVKIEFPIPNESPQRTKTHTVKDTNNPTYQESFKFEINRKSRSQLRQFKRQAVKFEVWSKGGIFRSNFLLGTVMVKLVDLETKCSVHNSFDLLDGRKACGGKLEIKIRIRDPILVKQVEEVKEKWLVIDS